MTWRISMMPLALFLSACETTYDYVRSGPGPELAYASAQCEFYARSAQGSFFAIGSPTFVVGASIGSILVEEARKQQIMKQCMTMQGWTKVTRRTAGAGQAGGADGNGSASIMSSSSSSPERAPVPRPAFVEAPFPPAPAARPQ